MTAGVNALSSSRSTAAAPLFPSGLGLGSRLIPCCIRLLFFGRFATNQTKSGPIYFHYFTTLRAKDPGMGVTPIIHYDPLDRVIRTELPDGSESRVEFDAWHALAHRAPSRNAR